MSLHHNDDNRYLFINVKDIFKFEADDKNTNFATQFCLESISNGFGTTESTEVSLKENMRAFSIDY